MTSPAPTTMLPVPAVGKVRAMRLPPVTDVTLRSGLRVLVARRATIPRFECRLIVPITPGRDPADAARQRLLTDTVLSGTRDQTSREIAEHLQTMGAGMDTYADNEQLVLGGSSLSSRRRAFLDLFGSVVSGAAFPSDEVAIERDRLVQEIALQRSQPATIAGDALARRLYGTHPYGWGTPEPDVVERVGAPTLRRVHRQRVVPGGSLMVLVGDLDPDKTVADVEAAFADWPGGAPRAASRPPRVETPAPALLIDRPDAVQTTIRFAGPGLARRDAGYPALALAVMVFGGYFVSRLNDNIREQKGFTYGAHARVEQRRQAAQITIATDVGRDVTAPAVVEIEYELARIASTPVTQAELDSARRFAQGSMSMGTQTQAGLTAYLSSLVAHGLPVSYLRDYPRALDEVTVADVHAAAAQFLSPRHLARVLVGDSRVIKPAIAPLYDVEASGAGATAS